MDLITIYNRGAPTIVSDQFDKVAAAKIARERNCFDSLSFTIYPDNPGYDLLAPFSTLVEVVNAETGAVEFDGRVISPVPSVGADGTVSKAVVCESVMGYLCDSRQPYTAERLWNGDTERTGLQEFIDYLLANHNAKVSAEKRVYRGLVDVVTWKTTENVTKGTNFETTWNCLKTKIIDVFGGEMRVRRGEDGRLYLDYRQKLGQVRQTPIRIGRNMGAGSRKVNLDGLVTRLYPRGAKLKATETDEHGNEREVETEERLSIASVNGGIPYIDDADGIREYGVIEGVAEWDDVTEPLNLKTKAENWFEDNKRLPVSTTLTAYDLSLIGEDYDSFALLDWYPCYNPYLGLDETLEVVKQTLDLTERQKSTLTFGETTTLQTVKISTLSGLAGEVEVVKSQSKTTIVNLRNTITYTMAAIEVAEDRIVSTVGEQIVETSERIDGEIAVVRSSVSTLEQTAEEIRANVSQLDEEQQVMQAELDIMPGQIVSTVTTAYEAYVDGEIKTVNTAISEVRQTAAGIESTVKSIQANYATCTTAGATVAKVASAPDFTLYKGAAISIKFTYANTADNPTLNVNGTGAKPIYVGNTRMMAALGWKAQDVVSFVYDGTNWRLSDCGSRSSIKQLSDSITLKVSKGDVSSQLSVESGAITIESNRFSWKSTYTSMTAAGHLTCTSGTIGGFTITSNAIYNDVVKLLSDGLWLERTGVDVGHVGTNNIQGDASKRGLVFDLESTGTFMAWSSKDNASDTAYTMKLFYARTAFNGNAANRLHAGCDLDMHGYKLLSAWIDPSSGGCNGGITGTFNFTKITNASSDGSFSYANNCHMTFKNGMLTSATW